MGERPKLWSAKICCPGINVQGHLAEITWPGRGETLRRSPLRMRPYASLSNIPTSKPDCANASPTTHLMRSVFISASL